jgi:hypothetical protein
MEQSEESGSHHHASLMPTWTSTAVTTAGPASSVESPGSRGTLTARSHRGIEPTMHALELEAERMRVALLHSVTRCGVDGWGSPPWPRLQIGHDRPRNLLISLPFLLPTVGGSRWRFRYAAQALLSEHAFLGYRAFVSLGGGAAGVFG